MCVLFSELSFERKGIKQPFFQFLSQIVAWSGFCLYLCNAKPKSKV